MAGFTNGYPQVVLSDTTGAALTTPFAVKTESALATYAATQNSLSTGATPTDFMILQGSATKTVKIRAVTVSAEATSAGSMRLLLCLRSTAASTGTPVGVTASQYDSTSSAATAVATQYTAAPTVGTLTSIAAAVRLAFPLAGVYAPVNLDFRQNPIILRGTSQYFTLNLNGGTLPTGGVVDFRVEWTEE